MSESTDPVKTAPLYALWLAIEMYNNFHKLKMTPFQSQGSITIEIGQIQSTIPVDSLAEVMKGV